MNDSLAHIAGTSLNAGMFFKLAALSAINPAPVVNVVSTAPENIPEPKNLTLSVALAETADKVTDIADYDGKYCCLSVGYEAREESKPELSCVSIGIDSGVNRKKRPLKEC